MWTRDSTVLRDYEAKEVQGIPPARKIVGTMSHVDALRGRLAERLNRESNGPNANRLERKPQHSSLLFHLPGEIRNKIYDFLADAHPEAVPLRYEKVFGLPNKPVSSTVCGMTHGPVHTLYRHIAFLKTCQHIYNEMIPLVYRRNTFKCVFRVYPRSKGRVILEPGLSLITNLRIRVVVYGCDAQPIARQFYMRHADWGALFGMRSLDRMQVLVLYESHESRQRRLPASALFLEQWNKEYPISCANLIRLADSVPNKIRGKVVWGPTEGSRLSYLDLSDSRFIESQVLEMVVEEVQQKKGLAGDREWD
jgi:hypothetical protein